MNNPYQRRFWLICLLTASFLFAQATQQLIGVGQTPNIKVTTSNTETGTSGRHTLSNEGFKPNNNAASRFLQQAGFGPNYEEIMALGNMGLENWIDQQFATPRGINCVNRVKEILDRKNAGAGTPDGGTIWWFFDYAFWEYSFTTSDILRQRVALALSEILVISRSSSFGTNPYPLAYFYDKLLDNAFGNYRDVLGDVTRQPSMGIYLTYINNPKQDTIYKIEGGDTLNVQIVFPDENYAREVMQLFTIGLCELNLDGTCQKDENGVDIDTYDNVDIAQFAKIFTGYTYATPFCEFGCHSRDFPGDYAKNMVMVNSAHDPGTKQLLNGHVVQPRSPVDGEADVEEALDNLFNHPNIGPFIGKLLIQRLVTSNPSPAYVERVAKAFNGESHYSTERGDMKAVIKAILLDDEARNCQAQNAPTFGMLREPFVRYLQLMHSFDLSSPSGVYRNTMANFDDRFGQKIFSSPSVFNFFQQDYQPIGPVEEAGKFAPEFQITNSLTIAGYMNSLNDWLFFDKLVFDNGWGYEGSIVDADKAALDFSVEVSLVDDQTLPELLDRLDLILAHGQLSQRAKNIIIEALKEMSIDGFNVANTEFLRLNRAKMAIYLVMASPEYLINK